MCIVLFPVSLFSSSVLRDRQQYTVKQQGLLYISTEYVRNLITDWRISDESKKKAGSISSSVKCAISHTSLILSGHTTVLFVCMSEMPTEMAVMLSKIFILLPGYSSETRSYLVDIETVKEGETERKRERKRERERAGGGGEGLHPLLKCQDVINSYKVNMEDFNLCLCQDKDFLRSALALFIPVFSTFSLCRSS